MMSLSTDNDPLTLAMAPPPGETPEARTEREKREREAQVISDIIDEGIKKDRLALKKQKNTVRVLLLGQSESGKSTTLKNFRIKYARSSWQKERTSWRMVIQLNLLRSVIRVLDAIQAEMDGDRLDPFAITEEEEDDTEDKSPIIFSDKHQLLKLHLAPLRTVDVDLKRKLGSGSEEVRPTSSPMHATPFEAGSQPTRTFRDFGTRRIWRHTDEFHVRSLSDAFAPNGECMKTAQDTTPADEATRIISRCKDEVKALWEDPVVRSLLQRRQIRLEESAGFFLDDLDRIATPHYEPTDDDILRARLRTLGVQEFKLHIDEVSIHSYGHEWLMYDVGGARTCRAAWLPYFENVTAVIFLAPISCFNERLTEDPSVNRLEDSLILWRSICSSKLLAKTTMIAFLNKCDLLRRKLKNGVMINKYLPSYGDRPNEIHTVVKYLRDKFRDILKRHSPEPRGSYLYATSVIDTKATASTLKSVRDGILREHLMDADMV